MKPVMCFCWILLAGLCYGRTWAQTGIRFSEEGYYSTLFKAEQANKDVFVYVYSDTCGACDGVARDVLTDSGVVALFNKNFVNAQVNVSTEEGKEMLGSHEIHSTPAFLFVTPDDQLMEKYIGVRDVAGLMKMGERMAIVRDGDLIKRLTKRFRQGDRDREFLYHYLTWLFHNGDDTDRVLRMYRKGMEGDALLEYNNWEIFRQMVEGIETAEFKYFIAHYPDFEVRYGRSSCFEKATNEYIWHCLDATDRGDKAAFEEGIRLMLASGIEGMEQAAQSYRVQHHESLKDYGGLVRELDVYISRYGYQGGNALNNYAWKVYQGSTDPGHLAAALRWAELSVQAGPNYANLDTQAMLLYSLGRKSEAVVAGNAAIELAKAKGEDYSATQTAMDSWK